LVSSFSSDSSTQDRFVALVEQISADAPTFHRVCRDCSGPIAGSMWLFTNRLSQPTRQVIDGMGLMAGTDVVERWPAMAISLHCKPVKSSFMRTLNQLAHENGVKSVPKEIEPGPHALAHEGRLGESYNEEAFQYFLEIERKRAQRSGRPFLLLLADLKNQPGKSALLGRPLASKLFAALWLCLRETDFVGWYREGRVAGAVLTQRAELRHAHMSQQILERITRVLDERLPRDVAARLQVRIYQPPDMLSGRWQ
jgi:hypothetical protein